MRKLIGLSGVIGSGKDTAAEFFLSTYPSVYHVKVAHILQDLVATFAGIAQDDLSHRKLFEDRDWKESYALVVIANQVWTPRELLKAFGDGLRQSIHPNVWIDILDSKIEALPTNSIVVISDIRYPNEMDWLLSNQGDAIYVRRTEAEKAFYESQSGKEIHASESHLESLKFRCTFCVSNNGSKELLYETLGWVFDEIQGREQKVKEIVAA